MTKLISKKIGLSAIRMNAATKMSTKRRIYQIYPLLR
jgi:hypothetical protein